MFGFDDIFDFDHDGSLDAFERDVEFQFMYEMTKSGESDSFDDDDEEDVFAEAGKIVSAIMFFVKRIKLNSCLLFIAECGCIIVGGK